MLGDAAEGDDVEEEVDAEGSSETVAEVGADKAVDVPCR